MNLALKRSVAVEAAPLRTFSVALAATLTLGLMTLGCGAKPGDSFQEAKKLPRIENPTLGIAIGAVPAAFKVESQEGEEIRLRRAEGEGEITIFQEFPEVGGVNLVQMVRTWKEKYQTMPEGKFLGQVELTTQFGPAYTVRGSYQEDGVPREERRIFCLHPDGDKVLTLAYVYPLGNNSRERTDELFGLVTELEALDFQAP